MELEPGRKSFELSSEAFRELTGFDLYPEGWNGLTSEERQLWNQLAFEREEKDRAE